MADFLSLQEIAIQAKRNLSSQVWDFLSGGAESETTLKRNRYALDSIAFRARVLVDVSNIDTSTTFLGLPLRIPVMLAPIGSLHLMHPGGAVPVVQAADRFGTVPFISTVTNPKMEVVAAATTGPKIFQLLVRGDSAWIDRTLDRAVAAGYRAIAITVDAAYHGHRDRDLISRFSPRQFVKWANFDDDKEKLNEEPDKHGFRYQAAATWSVIEHCRKRSGLPIILKGIATKEDAAIAIDHGVDALYVSNHGGRHLDHSVGAVDALLEVVDMAANRVEVVVDGGFIRGSDVVKALARGAKAVAIGKLQGWALAAAGEAGVVRALELLEQEIISTMGFLGVSSVSQLGRDHLASVTPMTVPHPLSPYPVFMESFS